MLDPIFKSTMITIFDHEELTIRTIFDSTITFTNLVAGQIVLILISCDEMSTITQISFL